MSGKQSYEEIKTAVMELVGQHFRPEFINRVDDSVVFHALTEQQNRRMPLHIFGLSFTDE